VGRRVNTDDLLDAQGVAEMLGLAQRNSVSLYQRRYADMPRPVVDLGPGRTKLWLRQEVEGWAVKHASNEPRRTHRSGPEPRSTRKA
jgi:predicted DNA-binding transcriptional regulator AlpA